MLVSSLAKMTTCIGYCAIQLIGEAMPETPITILLKKPSAVELSSQTHSTE